MEDVLFVAVPLLILVAMIVGLMAQHRWLRHRELITLAERGLVPPPKRRGRGRQVSGLTLTAIGLALCIGLYPLSAAEFSTYPLGMSPIMLVGLLPLFIGLSRVLQWQLGVGEVEWPEESDSWNPEPAAVEFEEQMPGHELPDVPGWLEAQGEPLPPGAAARAARARAMARPADDASRGA
jgi:hypothetical protein